jgi:hypothetical protein
MNNSKSRVQKFIEKPVTRRQAVKLGGLVALGLVFHKPIIETIVPKPAFANYVGQGCTPGFWKNHTSSWPAPYTPTTLFKDVFTIPGAYKSSLGGTKTLLQVLQQGGGCQKALGRHGVAALLNAKALGASNFGLSVSQVKTTVNNALATLNCSQIENAKNTLEGFNESSCPLGGKIADP